jgi:hypothetical protein
MVCPISSTYNDGGVDQSTGQRPEPSLWTKCGSSCTPTFRYTLGECSFHSVSGNCAMLIRRCSKPHPLVSLLMPAKGKRFLARLTKYLDGERALVILTLIVALFPSMDVVERAPLLDSLEPSDARAEVEAQTQTWLDSVPTFITAAVTYASFTQLVGWVDYLLRNTIVVQVASTRVSLDYMVIGAAADCCVAGSDTLDVLHEPSGYNQARVCRRGNTGRRRGHAR